MFKTVIKLFTLSLLMFSLMLAQSTQVFAARKNSKAKENVLKSPEPKSELNLDDLGITPQQQSGNQANQEILNQRSSMLQTHQILGLVTLGLMTATFFTSREEQKATDLHEYLGYASAASYAATAYYSLTAPELEEGLSEKGWSMKIHKALVFVHLPGMILTPIAGYLANKSYKDGKKPTGLGKYKVELANATYFSFAAAALSVTVNF